MRFRPKVLVVDDEPQMLELLGEMLIRLGVEPRCLTSSREAAELINQEKFDGVYLDWLMPEMDGLELAQRIRWSKSNSLCPIVMISGNPEPDALRRSFRCGINFFLAKPVSREKMQHLVTASHDLMLQEHLRYQRLPLKVPVHCTWEIASFEQRAKGQSVNLSSTGMLTKLDTVPKPGSLVYLKFTLPGDSQPYLLTAFVVRLGPDQAVGVRFINLTEAERWRLIGFSKVSLGLNQTIS